MGVLFPLLPFGYSSPTREEFSPLSWKYCYPLPAGFPRNRSPLKGDPPFRGTPSALGHEGVRGRRLHGAAMLCRLQCARFAKRVAHCRRTFRQPSALIRSPRRSRGGCAACERLVSGSTPNEITSCYTTSRSEFSLFRFLKKCSSCSSMRDQACRKTDRFTSLHRVVGRGAPSLYLVGMCNAFTFVSRGNIKSGGGGESGGSARFPHSERGFSGVKPRCEKFHKKTIFCGQIVIDNNILLWYDCRAFFGEDDNFRPELP